MADDGYNRNSIIGGYKGAPIKSSMLGKNLKTRGALSNNLPFRLANGLAPSNEYGFLFPTGTEAGAVWRFSQSGGQYQTPATATVPGDPRVSAVGQAVGLQLDSRILPIAHSLDLNAKAKTFAGTGASTFGIDGNTITITNALVGDSVSFTNEWPNAQWPREEVILLVESPVTQGNAIIVNCGNGQNILQVPAGRSIFTVCTPGAAFVNGDLSFAASLNPIPYLKITVLSITGYPGNHLFQATSTARPLSAIETVGQWGQSVYSARFDGIDDGMATPAFVAGALTANMDVFCAIKPSANASGPVVLERQDTVSWIGYFKPGDAVTTTAGGGILGADPFPYVNGIQTANNGDALATAIGLNSWKVLEYHNLNLSAWTQVQLGQYTAEFFAGNVGDIIICPAQSTANRNLARTLVGASVGLLL